MTENEKREEFKNILLELARSENLLQSDNARLNIYYRLEKLYCSIENDEHFRHFLNQLMLTAVISPSAHFSFHSLSRLYIFPALKILVPDTCSLFFYEYT